jgi:hypothetical protein
MPDRVKVYDLEGPDGKIEIIHTWASNANEIVRSDPKRFTLRKPAGKGDDAFVERDAHAFAPATAPAPEVAPNGMGVVGPVGTVPVGPDGAGTIKQGRDLTHSDGLEVTKEAVGEHRLALEYPEEAEEAAKEGEALQPRIQQNTPVGEEKPAARRGRPKKDD